MSINGSSIGIIMRTKNRPVLLQRALKSVCQQEYKNWQLVIVNDGGEAVIVDYLISEIIKEFSHIKDLAKKINVIHNKSSIGMEAASNKGISQLNTDLLVIHDDDDSWSPVFLLRMINILKKEQNIIPSIQGIICYSNRVIEEINGNIIRINHIEPFNSWLEPGLVPIERMLLSNMFPPISFIFSKKVYDELGGFDENLPVLGDWDFHLRFLLKYDVWILPDLLAFYHHRLSSDTCRNNQNTVTSGISIHQKYRKYLLNKYFRENRQLGAFMAQREYFEWIINSSRKEVSHIDDSYINSTLDRINFTYEKSRVVYRILKKMAYPVNYIFEKVKRII